jgi:hypothetical protein
LESTNSITKQHCEHITQQLQQREIGGGDSGAVGETPRIFMVKAGAALQPN